MNTEMPWPNKKGVSMSQLPGQIRGYNPGCGKRAVGTTGMMVP